MKQFLRLLLLTAFFMSAGLVPSLIHAGEVQSEETECEGEDCPAEEEPECD